MYHYLVVEELDEIKNLKNLSEIKVQENLDVLEDLENKHTKFYNNKYCCIIINEFSLR